MAGLPGSDVNTSVPWQGRGPTDKEGGRLRQGRGPTEQGRGPTEQGRGPIIGFLDFYIFSSNIKIIK